MRLDSNYHLSEGLVVRKTIKNSPLKLMRIGDVTKDIYCPGIFRRNYLVKGVPFLGGADIQKSYYDSGKYLSKHQTSNYKDLEIEEGWSLVTCGGTIGDVVFANRMLSKCWLSQHIMRVVPNTELITEGMLYAYLASKYGKLLLTTGTYGTVIPTINASNVADVPIPDFPFSFQKEIDSMIQNASVLREEASELLDEAEGLLMRKANLSRLQHDEYDYFGPRSSNREVSCYSKSISKIGTVSINAFNHSQRIEVIKNMISCPTLPLSDVLVNGETFSTGAFSRQEVKEGHGIMLINQSDAFDAIIKGKYITKRNIGSVDLVSYGEVLVAGVGTLGEGETFCRVLFAGEELKGQLVSGEFIRMKTNGIVPSGYLFAWLNSDYGFRILRSLQAGTKLCRPIPVLLLKIPVPILSSDDMQDIDQKVRTAHTKRHEANNLERKAIGMVEQLIQEWQVDNKKNV